MDLKNDGDNMEYIKLNDGLKIPSIGFGTFMIPADGTTYETVKTAINAGIRHIDTAVAYFNEQEVGRAVNDSDVERDDVWITSKLWLQDYEYNDAKKAIDLSLEKLGTDYMDLYLLHQPYGKVDEAWNALEEAKDENELREILNPLDVKIQAWGPLGHGNADLLSNPVILKIAEKYGKNAGQVILRFENQEEIIVFPKSLNSERIKSNMEIFDFKLTDSEMDEIRALDTGKGSHDPDAPGVGEMLMNAFDVHAND